MRVGNFQNSLGKCLKVGRKFLEFPNILRNFGQNFVKFLENLGFFWKFLENSWTISGKLRISGFIRKDFIWDFPDW